jgi:hypothetical protein
LQVLQAFVDRGLDLVAQRFEGGTVFVLSGERGGRDRGAEMDVGVLWAREDRASPAHSEGRDVVAAQAEFVDRGAIRAGVAVLESKAMS